MHHTAEVIFNGLGVIGFILAAGDAATDISSKVMADSMVLAWCLAGSFAATMLYALTYPPGPESPRGIWPTAVANFIFGMMLGPMVTQWLAPHIGLSVSLHTCMGITGLLALSCTWALKKGGPKLGDKALVMIDSVEFLYWIKNTLVGFKSSNEIKVEKKERLKELATEVVHEVKKQESDVVDPTAKGAMDKPTGLS